MADTTMADHIHIMDIELLTKFGIVYKIVGCIVTKMLGQNIVYLETALQEAVKVIICR